jgi:hypothetical protein
VDSLALVKQNALTNPVTGTGTTNYVPKFTGTSAIGNSQIIDNGTNVNIGGTSTDERLYVAATGYPAVRFLSTHTSSNSVLTGVGIGANATNQSTIIGHRYNTITPSASYFYIAPYGTAEGVNFSLLPSGNIGLGTTSPQSKLSISNAGSEGIEISPGFISNLNLLQSYNRSTSVYSEILFRASTYNFQIGTTNSLYINANNETLFNTVTDAGDYKMQVNGNAYVSGTSILSATSGNVGVGTVSPVNKLNVIGRAQIAERENTIDDNIGDAVVVDNLIKIIPI